VRALAVETGATPFVVLQAVFQVLIHRYTGRTDFLVGTIMAGRTGPGFDRTVGYFVNPVVLRAELAAESSFRSLIVDVRKTVRSALEHQDLPFAVLVEQLNPRRIANRSPLFQVAFGLTQLPFEAMDSLESARGSTSAAADGQIQFTPYFVPQQEGQFDLNLEFLETPSRVFGSFNYNSDLFGAETIERLIGHFRTLLDAVLDESDTAISALPMLTEAERADLAAWNARSDQVPAYRADEANTLPQLFEAQVARTPDAVAVESRGRSLTYAELNDRANRLAHHLRRLGVSPDDLVGILFEKSIEMVIGLVAIHKAGAAYVPMDPDYPDSRIDYMLADSGVRVLLTTQRLRHRYVARPQDTVYLDADVSTIEAMPSDNPATLVSGDNLAYVIYTSGSTGNPKGVMIPHRAVCNRLNWKREALGISPADRVLQTIPYSFDPSVWEIFTPLIAGARVVIPRPGTQQEPSQFVQEIIDHGITAFSCVPSLLEHLVKEKGFDACTTLRVVVCGGEPLAPSLVDRFSARSSGTIHHFYGPTEATIFATHWPCVPQPAGSRVPIGRAVSHAHVHILDDNRQPVPIGVPGELHIGGVGLARGYLNRPELTRDAFIDVPDGCNERGRLYRSGDLARFRGGGVIEFLGRTDTQVKLRGYRVELGEIENRLRAFPRLRDSVVVVRGDGPGQQRLVAHLVARDSDTPSVGEVGAFVAEALPDYMVPTSFVFHDALPVSPSGKIDRNALPDAEPAVAERPVMTPPADALETGLVRIWENVLNVKPIGTQDNFFDLGGHSLLAMRILSRIEKQLGVRLLAPTLFESPTVKSLAAALRQKGTPGASSSVVPIQPDGPRRPLFCAAPGHGDVIRFAALAQRMGVERPFYALVPPHPAEGERLRIDIGGLARRYTDEIIAISPKGPYLIGGFSVGGVIAMEVARELTRRGHDIGATVLLDTVYPTWSAGSFFLYRMIKVLVTRLGLGSAHLVGGRGLREIFTDKGLEGQLEAMRSYRFERYDGAVDLIMSRGNSRFHFQFFSKWHRRTSGGVREHVVPGWHGSMFRAPYISDLARILSGILARADGGPEHESAGRPTEAIGNESDTAGLPSPDR